MLTTEQKTNIASAVTAYCTANTLSQGQLAQKSGVNASYVSHIMRGMFTMPVGGNQTEIADKWFVMLADFIGYKLAKSYWDVIATDEFINTIAALEDSKQHAETRTIIIDTGNGKTFSIDRFVTENPNYTYVITLNEVYKIGDVLADLCKHLGLEETGSPAKKLKRICARLAEQSRAGNKPIIIFDEGEMASINLLRMLKSVYDGVKGLAGITLVGTPQLLTNIQRACLKDKIGMPQFFRRFKAGIRHIKTASKNKYTAFYEALGVTDTGLRKLLNSMCENYGELSDYLQPALRESDKAGEPLTEEFFRRMYNLPALPTKSI